MSADQSAVSDRTTHRAPRILCLANQKGGVGKTTTAINLGTALAAVGEKVLLVDLDPQGNASTGLGIAQNDRAITSFDVLLGECALAEAVRSTAVPGFDLLPASMDLLGVEVELADNPRRMHRLADELKALPDLIASGGGHYHYVLIDCPPSLNMLTLNAMVAAQSVLVPLQCEFFALEGLSQLTQTIEQVKVSLNPVLDIQGIVLTMYDLRNNLSGQVEADVRGHFGSLVYQSVIPRNVRVSEAPSFGKPALLYDHKCSGSLAYMKLASELIQRERERANAAA
ncbi:MAG TPA: chromosome partitioning protein ParA [Rhodobiaceae bacterium]|nr:MAG: Chromosome partitioning protein ParA [Rhodobiaceae bacterium UBA7378]HCQ81896.1 chromosome partitioning protein ParA [Rhodobiaceae bacterium]